MTTFRFERDSLGEVRVPADALWGAQTQRAIDNFRLSGERMPAPLIEAIALLKQAAARANAALGLLDDARADAIAAAAGRIVAGEFADQFPVDVYQTGSATSTHVNVNEVVASLAARASSVPVSASDHVNLGQSSNDVIPSAIRVASVRALDAALVPALLHLTEVIESRAVELADVTRTGRTHLMDAMPLTFGQALSAWAAQLRADVARLADVRGRLLALPLGGTAVGTGVNAHPDFAARALGCLAAATGIDFVASENRFAHMGGQDDLVELSGVLRVAAVTLTKIANDLRWQASGPLGGLNEIALPALQPGSSIMPGKVNPVIPEAVLMACAQIVGWDTAVTVAGQSGNFELNVMLPLFANNLLKGIALLSASSRTLADSAVAGFSVRADEVGRALARNPILVTALNPVVGYARAAEIAQRAYAQARPIVDVAAEMTGLPRAELERLLDPRRLAHPHRDG
jgi:fumarate hydratase class II